MRISLLFVAALVTGCAAPVDHATKVRADAPIVCSGDQQCTKFWEGAQVWLAQHSAFKIQTVSSSVIQTYGPARNSPALAFTILKEPGIYGTHSIRIAATCDNMFGCQPNAITAIANFKDYLLALP
ncbi:hypothetical protein LMG26689_03617 [Achromobacter animicus]|nr:hypothetical protein LMG26689_03617 [Achromobacter animicus]